MEVPIMKLGKDSLILYAVTDRSWLGAKKLSWQVEEAIKGGVTLVQLREKNLTKEEFMIEAKEVKEVCRRYQVPFLINDNIQVAALCEADGVHIGQGDMALSVARKILGNDKIIGVTVKTVEQALKAQEGGANYLGAGAVFPTSTKKDATGISYHTLKEICQAVHIPVVAIGGIHENNITKLSESGISGVAVISALFEKIEIKAAAENLRTLSESILK